MTSLLEHAQHLLQELPGDRAHTATVEQAVWDSSGLLLRTSRAGETAWYRLEGDLVSEVRPETDSRLPLASGLAANHQGAVLELLGYHPGRRIILKGPEETAPVVYKGYRRRHSLVAAYRYRLVQELESPHAFRTPRVLEHCAQDESLKLEHLAGERLDIAEGNAEQFFSIGVALDEFQREDSGHQMPTFNADNELAVLDRLAERCATIVPLPGVWSDLRGQLERAASAVPPPKYGLAHRDLHDGQFLQLDGRLSLLDFDLLCRGDTALDPANLIAHLRLRALQSLHGADEQGALACGEALLDGHDRGSEEGFWERFRFYQATTFLRLTLLYSLRPRWFKLHDDLIQLSRRCLEEIS